MDEKTKLKREWYREMRSMGKGNLQLLDVIWEILEGRGHVDEVKNQPIEMAVENLLADAEPYLKVAEIQAQISAPLPSPGEQEERAEREEIHSHFSDLECERAAAFEEYLARIAAGDARVRRFRERVLGGELLRREQARAFVNSPAAWIFSRRQFDNWGIPLVDHQAELKEAEERRAGGRVGWRFTVRVDPPGIERTIARRLRELPFVGESGDAESIMVGEGSVLGELAELSDKLTANYPWESKAEIVHFVLTGAVPPRIPPVSMYYSRKRKLNLDGAGSFRYGWITLEIATWISPKTVEAIVREAKRQVIGNRKYRRLEEKSLKMIRFITGYAEPPKGRQLLEAWNATKCVEKNPAWYYNPDKRGESSRFWRDYHRARRTLAYEKRPKVTEA